MVFYCYRAELFAAWFGKSSESVQYAITGPCLRICVTGLQHSALHRFGRFAHGFTGQNFSQRGFTVVCICSQSAAHSCEQFLQVQQIGFVTLGLLRHA